MKIVKLSILIDTKSFFEVKTKFYTKKASSLTSELLLFLKNKRTNKQKKHKRGFCGPLAVHVIQLPDEHSPEAQEAQVISEVSLKPHNPTVTVLLILSPAGDWMQPSSR